MGEMLTLPTSGERDLVEDRDGYRLGAVSLEDRGVWAGRLVHPDLPMGDWPAVPGRHWSTDVGIVSVEDAVHFGLRLACSSHEFTQRGVLYTTPSLIRELYSILEEAGVRGLSDNPLVIQDPSDVDALEDLLLSPSRSLPLVVLTEPDMNRLPLDVQTFVLDHIHLAKVLRGLAHVACLGFDSAREWTRRRGKRWSVFGGAVRVYNAGYDADVDSIYDHPLYVLEGILASHDAKGRRAEAAFEPRLEYWLRVHAAHRAISWEPIQFTFAAREELSATRLRRARDDGGRVQQLEQRVHNLHEELANKELECSYYVEEYDRVALANDQLRREVRNLQSRNDLLLAQLKERGMPEGNVTTYPGDYEDFDEWVESRFAGCLRLHDRAKRSLRSSVYADIERVAKALELLATSYRSMKIGIAGAKEEWERGIQRLELRDEIAASQTARGKYAEEYEVPDPFRPGHRRPFEKKLAKGNSKDQRNCLRIYYYYDGDWDVVVIGHLTGHLTTDAT